MEIVKLLRIPGQDSKPSAVLINDQGEEYPVFLESLTNTVYFNVLLESGYKFIGFPYQFKKDGMLLSDLPVEDYNPTDEEMEAMYNSIGAPMAYDELKAHISDEEVVGIETPPTHYTITTREDFIEYLDTIKDTYLVDDFMPINYFVAPAARFTSEEFLAEKNNKYVQTMNQRRQMSYPKFMKLFNWLKQFGLNDNASEMDVLDAYFAWGMDGISVPIISKRREQRPQALTGNPNAPVASYRWTQGFIDSNGNLLTPDNLSGIRWELPSQSPSYVQDVTQSLGVGDTVVQAFRCKIPTDVSVMEGSNYTLTYNADCAVIFLRVCTSISVESLVNAGTIPLRLAIPKNRQEFIDHCYMEALAKMLYKKRRCKVAVSSYKALTVCGANPYTALDYVATYDGAYRSSYTGKETEDMIRLDTDDIRTYLNGGTVDEPVKDYLDGIIYGTVNIDKLAIAKNSEASVNTTSVYNEIYALHYVFNIPLSEIYKKFEAITENDNFIVFEAKGLKHTMQVSQLKYSLNGYLSDIQNYDLTNAEKCTAFTYIVNVAREVGSEDYHRHVGIEFYMVLKRGRVNDLLDKLIQMYESAIDFNVSNAQEQAQLRKLKHMFALSRYFEAALNGTITMPDKLGGKVTQLTFDEQSTYAANLQKKIENLTAFCSYTVQSTSASTLSFNLYCTNAYVTPEYIVPRKGYKIHEASFLALWNDYSYSNPAVYAQLVGVGAIPQRFRSWSTRYEAEQFITRNIYEASSDDTLTKYAQKSVKEQNDWPKNLEFTCVEHPIEYLFPGVEHAERPEIQIAPREGMPVVRIGGNREIEYEDMKFVIYPDTEEEEEDQYIRQFTGFSAEAFEICPDILSKIPAGNNCDLMVEANSESIYVTAQERYINFRQITEILNDYDIVHVYDRTYLFRSLDGKLWEVRI